MAVPRAPKGLDDYVPPQSEALYAVRDAMVAPLRLAGYAPVELPVFEETGLFARGVGETTDVVSKEMFTFEDRGGRSMTLRPEGTVGTVRAALVAGLERGQLPVKLWYAGAMFRAENVQAGRRRSSPRSARRPSGPTTRRSTPSSSRWPTRPTARSASARPSCTWRPSATPRTGPTTAAPCGSG
jgi:hypothetical protein